MIEKKISNYLEFCSALNELLSKENFPAENKQTNDFIEAMQAWLMDTEGGTSFLDKTDKDSITWNDLLRLIQASAIYE